MVEKTQNPPEKHQQIVLFSQAEAEQTISENPLEEVKNAFDITCKQAFLQNPEGALRLMGIPGKVTLMEKNVELQRTSDLKVDLAFWVEYPVGSKDYPEGDKFLLHIEFQREAIIPNFDTMISKTAETGYYALTPEEARKEREDGMAEGIQKVLAMLSETQREKIKQRLGEENRKSKS